MIDLTLPPGQQPRELVVAVIEETFEHAMRLTDVGAPQPPQLGPAIEEARRFQAADDLVRLDRALGDVIVGAIATKVRVRAAMPTRGA
jgi:hypothetical protein